MRSLIVPKEVILAVLGMFTVRRWLDPPNLP